MQLQRHHYRCLSGPAPADLPSVMNVLAAERRQKWFAHEAAWKECGGDVGKAKEMCKGSLEAKTRISPSQEHRCD